MDVGAEQDLCPGAISDKTWFAPIYKVAPSSEDRVQGHS